MNHCHGFSRSTNATRLSLLTQMEEWMNTDSPAHKPCTSTYVTSNRCWIISIIYNLIIGWWGVKRDNQYCCNMLWYLSLKADVMIRCSPAANHSTRQHHVHNNKAPVSHQTNSIDPSSSAAVQRFRYWPRTTTSQTHIRLADLMLHLSAIAV